MLGQPVRHGWHSSIFLRLILTLSSCVPVATFQAARTLGEGGTELGVALEGASREKDEEGRESGPFLAQFFGRYGFSDRADAGVKFGLGPIGISWELETKGCLQRARWGLCGLLGGGLASWAVEEFSENRTFGPLYLRGGAIAGVSPFDWLDLSLHGQVLYDGWPEPFGGAGIQVGRRHRFVAEINQGLETTFFGAGYLFRERADDPWWD